MLYLAFKAAGGRFALPARDVSEVTPLVRLSLVPGAPPALAGLMNHRGTALPVADLTLLLCGRASRPLASTRIMVTVVCGGRVIGLMAERVFRTVAVETGQALAPDAAGAPFITGVLTRDDDILQLLDPAALPLSEIFAHAHPEHPEADLQHVAGSSAPAADAGPAWPDTDIREDGAKRGENGGFAP